MMSLREELVALARVPGANVSLLCRRFGVSRKTAYKWLARAVAAERVGGSVPAALADRSRRPVGSPTRTPPDLERRVVELRACHPAWGARKLRRRLQDLGVEPVPAASVVHALLVRNGLVDPAASDRHRAFVRFERPEPNDLWQMDFKGHFATDAERCHALTMLDDHSRYNLTLKACVDQRHETVKQALIFAFERYGLPYALLCDNGTPWGACGNDDRWTTLGVWLLRLGVTLLHGRPYHPQTQGKEERFHRTLDVEVIGTRRFRDLAHVQAAFDAYRPVYNHQRPHEALQLDTPASRYRPASRTLPRVLPTVEYASTDDVRKVDAAGKIAWRGRPYRVGHAFTGERVAVRPTATDGVLNIFYAHQPVAKIDLRAKLT